MASPAGGVESCLAVGIVAVLEGGGFPGCLGLEAYEPLWSPFTSDMERKFGFERQPLAAQVNLMTLARAVLSMFVALDGDQRAA